MSFMEITADDVMFHFEKDNPKPVAAYIYARDLEEWLSPKRKREDFTAGLNPLFLHAAPHIVGSLWNTCRPMACLTDEEKEWIKG